MKRLFLALVVATAVLATAVSHSAGQNMPPALVVTEPVKTLDFHEQLTLIGRSEARAESQIVAEVSGPVIAINAREGVWVSKGTPLVTIDSQRIKLALAAKIAEAAQAQADAELAEKEFARVDDLFKQEILSERVLDQAQADVTRTRERYMQLEAERERLALDLEKCRIRAPYAGYTIDQLIQIGEWANPGTPVYAMVDLAVIKVTVDLPERHFGQVALGSEVAIHTSGDGAPVMGKVTGVAPRASETTHTFPLFVTVDNANGALGGGMLVRATVSLKGKFTSLAVSKDAIIRQGDQTLVYTIVEGKASPITVVTSSSDGTMVAVRGDGLTDGMPVVVRGNERIFPGSPVRTPDSDKQPQKETGSEGAAAAETGNG